MRGFIHYYQLIGKIILKSAKICCCKYTTHYHIINKFKDKPYFERLVKYVENDGEDLTLKFHEQIKTLDKIRNENFEEVFPEWSERIMYW